MFRILFFVGFLSTISCVVAEKPQDNTTALIAYGVSVQEIVQSKLLNTLTAQRCSPTTICQDGFHCCSTTTCCHNSRFCCGGGRYCCTSPAAISRSNFGLVVAALLLYFGTSWLKSKN